MSDLLKQMKAEPGDILVEKSCETCVMNAGVVCMGSGKRKENGDSTYGMPMDEAQRMFPRGCDDYEISFPAFVNQENLNGR